MKKRSGIIVIIVLITSALSISSCAKSTYNHKYNGARKSYAASANPSSRKTTPVSKKYVVKKKRKRILGLNGTFR